MKVKMQAAVQSELHHDAVGEHERIAYHYDVRDLGAELLDGTLVLRIPAYMPNGPVLNKNEVERMMRAMDLDAADIDTALERFHLHLHAVNIGKILAKRQRWDR